MTGKAAAICATVVSLMICACNITFSPQQTTINVPVGTSRAFSSSDPGTRWILDDCQVATSQTYVYAPAPDAVGGHTLIARATTGTQRRWSIQVEPQALSIEARAPEGRVTALIGQECRFSVQVSAACELEWRLDGEEVISAEPLTFTYAPAPEDEGRHTVSVRAFTDTSSDEEAWEVEVVPSGGAYDDFVYDYDYLVSTREEFLTTLEAVLPGEIIYLVDDAVIDLSGLSGLEIPAGVTLASGRGKEAGVLGALIFKEAFTGPAALFRVRGDDVRLTGLRLRGPGAQYAGSDTTGSRGITTSANLEVDNCELFDWSYAAIDIQEAPGIVPHIHHNHIHDCWGPLGYGVMMGVGEPLIEHNVFDRCRHAIAGVGQAGCSYEARYNTVLSGRPDNHCFDMHSDSEALDPYRLFTTRYMAGDWIRIHHNTFAWDEGFAVSIRGKPRVGAEIHDNRFRHVTIDSAVRQKYNPGNMSVYDNELGYGLSEDQAD